jgi:hypothetical protein
MQEIPESARRTVDSIHMELLERPGPRVSQSHERRVKPKAAGPRKNLVTRSWRQLARIIHGQAVENLPQIVNSERVNWWTWSGSNRRPLPCHGISQTANYRRHST